MPVSDFDMMKQSRLKSCDKVIEWLMHFYTSIMSSKSGTVPNSPVAAFVDCYIKQIKTVLLLVQRGLLVTWFKMCYAFFFSYYRTRNGIAQFLRGRKKRNDAWEWQTDEEDRPIIPE